MANVQAVNSRFFLAVSFCVFCVVNGGVVKRSDDVNTVLENIQVLVQQQAAVISSMQAKLTALESRVGILSKTVAFSVRFSRDDGNAGLPLSHNTILQFDQVVSNSGNGYNPTTGIFTAPAAGDYAFSVVIMEPVSSTHPSLAVSIVKNGAIIDMAYAENAIGDVNEQGSTFTVMNLAVGDQVWVRQEAGDGVRGSFWTVFTGFLVHAE